ncbi:MAG: hypothetical protein ACYCVN_09810 [Acidimicrobiales bacterium]
MTQPPVGDRPDDRDSGRGVDDVDSTTTGSSRPQKWWHAVRSATRPEPPRTAAETLADNPAATIRSVKWAVDRLDARERRYTFVAAAAAVLFGVLIYVTETDNKNFRLAKGQLTPQTVLVIGVVAGLALLGAGLLGRRAPVGFMAFLTGLAFSGSNFIVSLPFLGLGVWVFVHSYRTQREATEALRTARAQATANNSGRDRGARSRTPAEPATGGRRRTRSSGPAGPVANKRYTPKKPAPPAAKPSRRARRAAAGD